jgi:SAM-dependent methyltransferase
VALAEATALGEMHAASFAEDPKHLAFVLARYLFVSKMLAGKDRVLEIGCGDTTGARIVKPVVGQLEGVDIKPYPNQCIQTYLWDFTKAPFSRCRHEWDAAYTLDVLEHIHTENEHKFLKNISICLNDSGVLIVGTPSLESQKYASALSKLHHVNAKTEDDLRNTLLKHFKNVFMFGLNDMTLHTGFGAMCHYRFALCVGPHGR